MSDISVILASLGGDQPNPSLEAELAAMGRYQSSFPDRILAFSDGTHPTFSNGTYLRFAT